MERICRRTVQKNLNDLDNHNGVVITQSQTFRSVNSGGSYEALLSIKLVDVMGFH